MFIACDMSDLFHSTNNGVNWSVVDFRQVLSTPASKVCYTKNPKILYTLDFSWNGGNPTKSIDGGKTWNHLSGWGSSLYAYNIFSDIKDSLRLFVSTWNNIYFTKDGGKTFNNIYYYGGTAWNAGCYVAGAFFDANNIYVATKTGLLVSTDSGKTFAIKSLSGIANTEGFISFAGAKQNGFTRFYCITADTNYAYPGVENLDYTVFRGVYKLDSGSTGWVSELGNINTTYQNPLFCGMAQNDTSTVYLAGSWTPPPYVNGNPIVFKSVSGSPWRNVMNVGEYQQDGQSQNVYTGWVGYKGDYPWFSSCPMGFSIAPMNSKRAMITALGDAYVTSDSGHLWRQLYEDTADENPPFMATPQNRNYHSNGLEVTGCWTMYWSDSQNIFTGYTDIRGTRSTDGGKSWDFNFTGQNLNTLYHIIKNPLNGYMYGATSAIHCMYRSTNLTDRQDNPGPAGGEDGMVIYSGDKGATWKTAYDFGHPVIRLAVDPTDNKRMYAAVVHHTDTLCVGGIYVCNDITDSAGIWRLLLAPPRTEGHPYDLDILKDGSIVCTYSARYGSSGFTKSSGVFFMPKDSTHWQDRSDLNMEYYTKDLIIDPYDASQNTWYVAVNNGWGGPANDRGGLYRTKNRGITWSRLTPSAEPAVFSANVEGGTISPYDKNEMYMTTTNYGLWYTDNLTDSVPTFTQLHGYPFSAPQRVFYNPYIKDQIWICSFGNGLRYGINTNVTTGIDPENHQSGKTNLQVYPNPAIDKATIQLPDRNNFNTYSIEILNLEGQVIRSIPDFNGSSMTMATKGLLPGIYICRVIAQNGNIYITKFVVQ